MWLIFKGHADVIAILPNIVEPSDVGVADRRAVVIDSHDGSIALLRNVWNGNFEILVRECGGLPIYQHGIHGQPLQVEHVCGQVVYLGDHGQVHVAVDGSGCEIQYVQMQVIMGHVHGIGTVLGAHAKGPEYCDNEGE